MGRGGSYDKYLARLDARDAERARVRDERVAAREEVLAKRRRVVSDFAERMAALGVPVVDLPNRHLAKLPLTRRPRGSKPTRIGDLPRRIDREVVEEPSGVQGWPTHAYLPAYQGEQSIHQPIYVATDGRLVAENRQERLVDGPAVHAGRQVGSYSPGWRYIEPPELVEVRGSGNSGAEWLSLAFEQHLARVVRDVERAHGPEGPEG